MTARAVTDPVFAPRSASAAGAGPVNSDPWGIDSEFAPLKDVLLCRPDHMRWVPEDNAVTKLMAENGAGFDLALAKDQHQALADTLAAAGVRLHWLDLDPGQSDQVFTRDSSFLTPWGAVITLMSSPFRRGEYAKVLEFYLSQNIPVWRLVTEGTVEGGDVHVIAPGKLMIGYSGLRTSKEGAEQVAGWFRDAGWETRLIYFPEHFLHIDVLFCVLAEGVAVICTEVLGAETVADLKAEYGLHTIIDVSYSEAMALGANGVALGEGRVLMAKQQVGSKIAEQLRAGGLQVTELDLSQFVLDGGGPHCLTMPLRRQRLGVAPGPALHAT